MAQKLSPPELLAIAERRERRLTSRERRAVIAWLDEERFQKEHSKLRTNYALAALFGTSETLIRGDRKKIAAAMINTLTPDQAISFVQRHLARSEQLIRAAERGLDSQPVGSIGERAYMELINKLGAEYFEALQGVGIVQKNLGQLSVTEECWMATTTEADITSVNRITIEEAEAIEAKRKQAEDEAAKEA